MTIMKSCTTKEKLYKLWKKDPYIIPLSTVEVFGRVKRARTIASAVIINRVCGINIHWRETTGLSPVKRE